MPITRIDFDKHFKLDCKSKLTNSANHTLWKLNSEFITSMNVFLWTFLEIQESIIQENEWQLIAIKERNVLKPKIWILGTTTRLHTRTWQTTCTYFIFNSKFIYGWLDCLDIRRNQYWKKYSLELYINRDDLTC